MGWGIGASGARDNPATFWWTPVLSLIERLVPPLDGRLEPLLGGELLEVEALGCVAGHAVEDGAEDLRGVEALCVHGLIHEQLHHRELVHGRERDPLNERLEVLVELGGGRRL